MLLCSTTASPTPGSTERLLVSNSAICASQLRAALHMLNNRDMGDVTVSADVHRADASFADVQCGFEVAGKSAQVGMACPQ
jgi:hypothetical protein